MSFFKYLSSVNQPCQDRSTSRSRIALSDFRDSASDGRGRDLFKDHHDVLYSGQLTSVKGIIFAVALRGKAEAAGLQESGFLSQGVPLLC